MFLEYRHPRLITNNISHCKHRYIQYWSIVKWNISSPQFWLVYIRGIVSGHLGNFPSGLFGFSDTSSTTNIIMQDIHMFLLHDIERFQRDIIKFVPREFTFWMQWDFLRIKWNVGETIRWMGGNEEQICLVTCRNLGTSKYEWVFDGLFFAYSRKIS